MCASKNSATTQRPTVRRAAAGSPPSNASAPLASGLEPHPGQQRLAPADSAFAREEIVFWARTALRQAGVALGSTQFEHFLACVEQSVATFHASDAEVLRTSREAHDALRGLWRLLLRDDPAVGQIRLRAGRLSGRAREWIYRRASRLWPRLLGREFSEADFRNWQRTADTPELTRILRGCIADGARLVQIRKDRPGRLTFEPMIMGAARGAGGLGPGGRPPLGPRDELVMHLAIDWLCGTGQRPLGRRTDTVGFSGLVHRVFQLNEIDGAEQALRRYWTAVRAESQYGS